MAAQPAPARERLLVVGGHYVAHPVHRPEHVPEPRLATRSEIVVALTGRKHNRMATRNAALLPISARALLLPGTS